MGILDPKFSKQIADTIYAPVTSGQIGYRWACLGDSIDEGFITGTRGDKWPTYATLMSGGRLELVKNAGKGGDTSGMALARIDADVLPYKPHFCTVKLGTNDIGTGVSFATFKANIKAIVAKLKANNIVPVLATIPPYVTNNAVPKWNLWVKRYAGEQRLLLIDFFSLLADPATGEWKAGYSNDLVHPLSVPLAEMGALAYATLDPYLAGPLLVGRGAQYDTDPTNYLSNSMFNGTYTHWTGGTIPTGWDANNVTGRTLTVSATDPDIGGKWLSMERTAGADESFVSQYIGGTPAAWATGDLIGVGYWLRVTNLGAGSYYSAGTNSMNESGPIVQNLTQPLTSPAFHYREYTLTSVPGQVSIWIDLIGTGKIEISRPAIINLTQQGVLS